jgi:hypothetical protein
MQIETFCWTFGRSRGSSEDCEAVRGWICWVSARGRLGGPLLSRVGLSDCWALRLPWTRGRDTTAQVQRWMPLGRTLSQYWQMRCGRIEGILLKVLTKLGRKQKERGLTVRKYLVLPPSIVWIWGWMAARARKRIDMRRGWIKLGLIYGLAAVF